MPQIHVGINELNERVQIPEARATDAERQAQAARQELARSQQAGAKGKEKGATPPQLDEGIGAFEPKYQLQPFEAEEDKWREWVRVFRIWW